MSSLYLDRKGIELSLDGEALTLYEDGSRTATVPLAPITRVFMRGDIKLNASVLGKLGSRGIGVVILSGRKSEPTLLLTKGHNFAQRRYAQYKTMQDMDYRLIISKLIVQAKLSGQKNLLDELTERRHDARYELTTRSRIIGDILRRLEQSASLPILRGQEGAAAAAYFAGLQAVLPARIGFAGRNRRPPLDPFNAVLSLSYTLLHSEGVLALHSAGLDPMLGFYHELNFGRDSLACDIIEPLRPNIDRFALRLFNTEILTVADFSTTTDGCFMGKAGRVRFYKAYEAETENLRKEMQDSVDTLVDILADIPSKPNHSVNTNQKIIISTEAIHTDNDINDISAFDNPNSDNNSDDYED
jgi:CRISPR-associated protein Cas1